MGSKQQKKQQIKRCRPRLDRLNAVKNVDYEEAVVVARVASWSNSCPPKSVDDLNIRTAKSLDIFASLSKQSFRIDGSCDNEVEILCQSLGLTGPDDFAISVQDWEKMRARSPSDILPRSSFLDSESSENLEPVSVCKEELQNSRQNNGQEIQHILSCSMAQEIQFDVNDDLHCGSPSTSNGEGNICIQDVQPSVLDSLESNASISSKISNSSVTSLAVELKPPPYMVCLPTSGSIPRSSWDIIRSFGPDDDGPDCDVERREQADTRDLAVLSEEVAEQKGFLGDNSEDSTLNADETSSSTTEVAITVSPNSRLKRRIKSWTPGELLGSGSFGRVFEAINEEGVFFAVKEVTLLDQGSNAQPCVNQLEQEIALLSKLEHENIVQYYGTDKEEGKLFIFLELASQGSIVALYQKYILQDSQVSAYTKQILNGLNYLHERNVVHRDIKCANILVHANGSVKLADFGLAKEMSKIDMLKSCKGSVYWMAPEVVNPRRTYGPPADIWSLGCTVLEMLTRDIPFPNVEWAVAFYMIGQGQQPPIPDNLSRVARDFIGQCVRVNPDDRPTAAQLLEHPFIRRSSSSTRSKLYPECNGRWW